MISQMSPNIGTTKQTDVLILIFTKTYSISFTFLIFGGFATYFHAKTECCWTIVEKVRLLNAESPVLLAAKMIALPSVHAIEAHT